MFLSIALWLKVSGLGSACAGKNIVAKNNTLVDSGLETQNVFFLIIN